MWKLPAIIAFTLVVVACAHHRQPKARCTGHLERINVSTPATPADSSPQQQELPNDQTKREGNEP
jgi:hypothetical protein